MGSWEHLPPLVKSAYNEAKARPPGERRNACTEVINSYYTRDEHGKLVAQPSAPIFAQQTENVKNKYFQENQGGVIKEEAETKCGGEAKLQKAVADGRVKVVEHHGLQMYFFPTVQIGTQEETTQKEVTMRAQEISQDSYAAVTELVDTFNWSLKSSVADTRKQRRRRSASASKS